MTDTTADITRVDCLAGCQFARLEHVHLEAADGCGQVWGNVDGELRLLDLFDLQRTAVKILPPRRGRR